MHVLVILYTDDILVLTNQPMDDDVLATLLLAAMLQQMLGVLVVRSRSRSTAVLVSLSHLHVSILYSRSLYRSVVHTLDLLLIKL